MVDAGMQSSFLGPVIRWNLLDTGRVRARSPPAEAAPRQLCSSTTRPSCGALHKRHDAFKAHDTAGSTLGLRMLEASQTARLRVLPRLQFVRRRRPSPGGARSGTADLPAGRAGRRAYQPRLAVVSIYKALGGGWEICAQASDDCEGSPALPSEATRGRTLTLFRAGSR